MKQQKHTSMILRWVIAIVEEWLSSLTDHTCLTIAIPMLLTTGHCQIRRHPGPPPEVRYLDLYLTYRSNTEPQDECMTGCLGNVCWDGKSKLSRRTFSFISLISSCHHAGQWAKAKGVCGRSWKKVWNCFDPHWAVKTTLVIGGLGFIGVFFLPSLTILGL